jgi:hypothetical protein
VSTGVCAGATAGTTIAASAIATFSIVIVRSFHCSASRSRLGEQ